MIQLKDYQQRVLDSFRMFLRQCARDKHPEAAFEAVQRQNGRVQLPYLQVPMPGPAAGLPYVCLRVPTGGGKTLLACHAAGLAMHDLLHAERAVVLWLVPSNTLLKQTVDALRDKRHPYRRALELSCGTVEVVAVEEALQLSRARVDGATVVIVATIQAFRAEDTTGRKVYGQNGVFSEYLLNVPPDRVPHLLPGGDGKPMPSLVNMLRLRRPIVIVDEAHNARTALSFEALGNVLPSCIIEFSATPAREKQASNVLHHVSAAELKQANMVKLPLRVITRHASQRSELLADAISLRADLEKLAMQEAQQTGEYLRPILLIQAERVNACEPLREQLVQDFNLDRDGIKICVGAKDELPSAEVLQSPKCPVRFIITVQKLREGWDCPFAYVLCSLRETRSPTAIEQIVGRVLRLPGAALKRHADLNCAYAFSVSPNIGEVLEELRAALESNGFTAAEADRIVIPASQVALPLGLQPVRVQVAPREIDVLLLETQLPALAGKAEVNAASGAITIMEVLTQEETEKLTSCVNTPGAKAKIEQAAAAVRETDRAYGGTGAPRVRSPYERNCDFVVPVLCVREGELLLEFESTFLLEHPWRLSERDATLRAAYNPLERPKGYAGTLDVGEKGEVQTSFMMETQEANFVTTLHQQVLALETPGDWTLEALVAWLDHQIPHEDIPLGESAAFLHKVLRGLMATHGAELGDLAADRFRLCAEIEARIQQHRAQERKVAFQMYLEPNSPLEADAQYALNFKNLGYEPSWLYEGSYQFKKHYYGPKPGELAATTPNGRPAEEAACAEFLDQCAEVAFWVRNLARKNTSFRLQTSTDFFYPDFLCQLIDGRVLAVEYKGKDRYDAADAEEKRAIGAVWAARSNGKCLFCMPTDRDFSEIEKVIREPA